MMKHSLLIGSALITLFFSCRSLPSSTEKNSLDQKALAVISEKTYQESVEKLASDEFQGRKPFTKGDTITVNYIENQFKSLGLKPGNGKSYFQEVPLVESEVFPANSNLTITGKNGSTTLTHLDDFVIGTSHLSPQIDIEKTDLVFAGFGIVAPEFNWNDYANLDVKGKTVVVMVSDPGRYDKTLFKGDTLTYYGRWTYKIEEASRQGATGVIIIHETKGASYGWNVVRNSWNGPQLSLIPENNGLDLVKFKGWMTTEAAKQVFNVAGLDPNLIEQAKKPGFKPVPMQAHTSVKMTNKFRVSKSNNVIAMIPGTKRAEETVIYTAHWDHLGIGEPTHGDSIYNGAIDNASGVAALFELAKAFKAAKVAPERSIVFLAVTAEEEGLLGSQYYTENPIYPLNKTVGNINIDCFNVAGAMNGFSVTGTGQTELEDYAARSAAKFNRSQKPEGSPASGGFFRSDHFNFVKKGVPAIYMGSAGDFLDPDKEAVAKRQKALAGRYHTVNDHVDSNWQFDGIIADIKLYFDMGYTLSMEKSFPNFKTKSEFKELGDKRLAK
ncbi:M20/M25/M40 family metallo-hydrolase [Sphingobacterium sp. HJSM2_6]|uniref:M20/M25/M40 family metallo-hydrolase n=1 Tax=Sphingobacterium sp. HJSM2_6 TaxID=3366264 RepID=UPI003BE21B88